MVETGVSRVHMGAKDCCLMGLRKMRCGHMGGLDGDEEGLEDVLDRLELARHMVGKHMCINRAAISTKRETVASILTMGLFKEARMVNDGLRFGNSFYGFTMTLGCLLENNVTQREAQQANKLSNLTRQRQLLTSVNNRRAIIEELECLLGNFVAYKTTEHLKRIQKAIFVEVIDLKKEFRLQVHP
ncbi:hypothetical protein Tco_0183280 [Tanacetum coccineum]